MKILVLHIRGLRPAFLGCYGNDWVDTAALDRLAADSVVFDQHHADNLDERTSWTGQYHYPGPTKTDHASADLPALLEQAALPFVHVAAAYAPRFGSEEAVDYFDPTLEVLEKALAEQSGNEHWLIWVDLPDLLPPWSPSLDVLEHYFSDADDSEDDVEALEPLLDPPDNLIDAEADALWEQVKLSYAAAVTHFDHCLEVILQHMRECGLLEQTMLIVTSEAGVALGEHGRIGDGGPGSHAERTHLPLLVRLPGGEQAGRRVAALTQPVDLFPTLLAASGAAIPEQQGQSLWPLLRGETAAVRAYLVAVTRHNQQLSWLLRSPDWSLLQAAEEAVPKLYVKPEDRWEVNDVYQHHQEWAAALQKTRREFVRASQQPGPFQSPPLPDPDTFDAVSENAENSTP